MAENNTKAIKILSNLLPEAEVLEMFKDAASIEAIDESLITQKIFNRVQDNFLRDPKVIEPIKQSVQSSINEQWIAGIHKNIPEVSLETLQNSSMDSVIDLFAKQKMKSATATNQDLIKEKQELTASYMSKEQALNSEIAKLKIQLHNTTIRQDLEKALQNFDLTSNASGLVSGLMDYLLDEKGYVVSKNSDPDSSFPVAITYANGDPIKKSGTLNNLPPQDIIKVYLERNGSLKKNAGSPQQPIEQHLPNPPAGQPAQNQTHTASGMPEHLAQALAYGQALQKFQA